jgi:hypothetical protein
MGFWKGVACVAGAIGCVVAAPIILPAIASVASAAAATSAGAAAIGAATTAGTAVAGAASVAGAAVASTSIGGAVVGAASAAGSAVASSSVAGAVATAAASVGSAAAGAGVTTGVAAAATFGGGMTYSTATVKEAFDNFESAENMVAVADARYKKASKKIDVAISNSMKKLEKYNSLKIEVYSSEIKDSIALLKRIQNVKEASTDYFDSPSIKDMFSHESIKKMEASVYIATGIGEKLKKGATLASATASLTTQVVSKMGFASTGTAISSLSGAAAQRATLAALGGGALRSGGAGMMGGQIILGGLTLVPTAMLASWKMASNSEKALTAAHKQYSKLEKATAQIEKQNSLLLSGLLPRVDEMSKSLRKLSSLYQEKVLPKLASACNRNAGENGNVDFASCSKRDQDYIANAANYLKVMVSIMRVKVLDGKGNLNPKVTKAYEEIESNPMIQGIA